MAVVRGAGARETKEAVEARLAGKTKADYSRWIVCFFITHIKKAGYLKRDSLPIYSPLKMELNEGITRLARFGKPQFTQRK